MHWFRVYHDLPQDPKIRRLSVEARWVWITLLCLASASPQRGVLLLADGVPLTLGDIADAAKVEDTTAAAAIAECQALGLVTGEWTTGLRLPSWDARQYGGSESSARVRAWRERQRGPAPAAVSVPDEAEHAVHDSDGRTDDVSAVTCNVTRNVTRNVTVTPPDPDPDPEYSGSPSPSPADPPDPPSPPTESETPPRRSFRTPARAEDDPAFLAAWAAYPRHTDRQRAWRAWLARRQAGAAAEALTAAAAHYAAYCTAVGTEPRFIKHAATFWGPDEPWREWQTGPPPGLDARASPAARRWATNLAILAADGQEGGPHDAR
jgi:hypothetical protein